MKKTQLPDFTNKFVLVGIIGNEHDYGMDCPRFEIQGDRLFLVGVVPRGYSNGDWMEGALCAVVWDKVASYLVFDSAEHYRKGLKKFHCQPIVSETVPKRCSNA